MAQASGPISQGTLLERQFTDVLWRDLFGSEPGVISDMNGSAYALTLPSSGDIVSVGSTSQNSLAQVAGFVHKIVAGSTEPLTIPTASGSARTDLVALRYDPAFTGSPGPVRLVRIAGTSADPPIYDATPGGIEELPLWSITRSPAQSLSQATIKRLFPRLAPRLDIPTTGSLPLSSPLGTLARIGTNEYVRALDSGNNPFWQQTVVSGGQWSDLASSATDYSYPVTTSWVTLPGMVGSVTVPPGRTLDVEFRVPKIEVNTGGGVFLRLMLAGSQKDAAKYQAGSTSSFATAAKLSGSVVGTGVAVSVAVQAQKPTGNGGGVQADGIGPVVLRYRIL